MTVDDTSVWHMAMPQEGGVHSSGQNAFVGRALARRFERLRCCLCRAKARLAVYHLYALPKSGTPKILIITSSHALRGFLFSGLFALVRRPYGVHNHKRDRNRLRDYKKKGAPP